MPDERREGYDIGERAARLERYPSRRQPAAEIFTNYDERFEDGLWIVVAGIEARYGVT